MEFKFTCVHWVREADETVSDILLKSDRCLSAKDLSDITGISEKRIERIVRKIAYEACRYNAKMNIQV